MMSRMQLLHALTGHMGIDLRGRYIRVSEQQLDNPQIRAVIDQMRGECMAQGVR